LFGEIKKIKEVKEDKGGQVVNGRMKEKMKN
jgi:hypothetical protein